MEQQKNKFDNPLEEDAFIIWWSYYKDKFNTIPGLGMAFEEVARNAFHNGWIRRC